MQPLSEDTVLTLMSAKMEDSGIYVCEGMSQLGTSKKSVELTIQGEQSMTFKLFVASTFSIELLIVNKVMFEKKAFRA